MRSAPGAARWSLTAAHPLPSPHPVPLISPAIVPTQETAPVGRQAKRIVGVWGAAVVNFLEAACLVTCDMMALLTAFLLNQAQPLPQSP